MSKHAEDTARGITGMRSVYVKTTYHPAGNPPRFHYPARFPRTTLDDAESPRSRTPRAPPEGEADPPRRPGRRTPEPPVNRPVYRWVL